MFYLVKPTFACLGLEISSGAGLYEAFAVLDVVGEGAESASRWVS